MSDNLLDAVLHRGFVICSAVVHDCRKHPLGIALGREFSFTYFGQCPSLLPLREKLAISLH
jgi:hypothetical protein